LLLTINDTNCLHHTIIIAGHSHCLQPHDCLIRFIYANNSSMSNSHMCRTPVYMRISYWPTPAHLHLYIYVCLSYCSQNFPPYYRVLYFRESTA